MSESVSATTAVTAPALIGVWVFDPVAADATDKQFLHTEGRTETVDVGAAETQLEGRLNPIVEYGTSTRVELVVTVFIPFGSGHRTAVDYWQDVLKNRRTICYRDGRGRLIFAAFNKPLGLTDGRAGTALALSFLRVDYDEAA